MDCVADSGGERTYRAVVPVPSSAHGAWRVRVINFRDTYGLDPRTFGLPDATLTVTGTHRPRLRISQSPRPLPYPQRTVTLIVQASFDDTREPLVGQRVDIMWDIVTGCSSCSGTTDAKGRVMVTVTLTDSRSLLARMQIRAPGFYDWRPDYSFLTTSVVVQPVLVAAPAKGSVPKGTNVAVDGRAGAVAVQRWPSDPRVRVYLQRLVGRYWRTVGESTIRPNGRFTLVATPPRVGTNVYRVTVPPQQDFGSARSGTFTIRGT